MVGLGSLDGASTRGAELREALGGNRPAATRAAVRWLTDHTDIDTTHLVHDAKALRRPGRRRRSTAPHGRPLAGSVVTARRRGGVTLA